MNKPLGPYSPFVRAGDFIIVSGQGGMKDGAIVEGGVAAQTAQTMANLAERLAEAGASLSDIVKTTCFLTDMDTFATFNAAYGEALRQPPAGPFDRRGVGVARWDGGRGRGVGLQARLIVGSRRRLPEVVR